MDSTSAHRIGLLGGSFNPVHEGHLAVARAARDALGLETVVFIPAAQPPHRRDTDMAPAEARLAMVRLAVADVEGCEADDIEFAREGPSYTVDTVLAYRERLGPSAEIFFVVGADTLPELATWYRIDALATLCRFAVVTRPGSPVNDADARALGLPPTLLDAIARVEIPGVDISATDVRRRLAQGEPVTGLVPAAVERCILEHGLYASSSS